MVWKVELLNWKWRKQMEKHDEIPGKMKEQEKRYAD